jgi:hypothetical protein
MLIPLTVSGIDAKGHIFRELTVVQGLEGRDCQYQSKHEVRVDSVVLLDLDYSETGQPPCRVQGRVKSLRTPQTDSGLFQINVELDTLQSLRIIPHAPQDQFAKQNAQATAAAMVAPEAEGVAVPEVLRHEAVPQGTTSGDALSQLGPVLQAATAQENLPARESTIAREAAKAAVASEIGVYLAAFKNSLQEQIERSVQAALAPTIEDMVRDAVEKRMAAQDEAGIQTLRADLTHRLAERLSKSDELRNGIKETATELAERLSELSQSTVSKVEGELNTRTIALRQSIEETVAEVQDRINHARTGLAATLSRAQVVDKDINEVLARVQKAVAQIEEADRTAAEWAARHLSLQVDAWSA